MTDDANAHPDQGPGDEAELSHFDEATLEALPAPDPDEPVDRADVIGGGARWLAAWSGRLLLVAGAVLVVGWVALRFWDAILPVLLALLFASVLWPAVAAMRRVGIPQGVGAAIGLLAGIGGVVGLFSIVAPAVAAQWPTLWLQAISGVRKLQLWAAGPPLNIRDEELNNWINQAIAYVQEHSGELVTQALSLGGSLGNGIVTLLLTLVLTFFFLKDGTRFVGFTRRIVGRRAGFHASELLTRLWLTLSGYIRTQAIVSLADAFFIGLGLVILGVPLAMPIAILTFMAGFIPMVGAVTAGALAVLVALVTNGFTTALLALGLVVLVQQLEGNLLQPLLQSRVMKLHPAIVLLAVLLGGTWAGIIGAFLAVPVAASVAVVLRYLGELVDLRTGDRTAADIEWVTDDGHTIAHQSERSGAVFRALLRRRTAEVVEELTDPESGDGLPRREAGWLRRLTLRGPENRPADETPTEEPPADERSSEDRAD